MSKAIGWDIGIKNLAYCILDTDTNIDTLQNTITFNNKKYNITKWQDISLVKQIESNLQVSGQVSHINNNLKCCFEKDISKSKSKSKSKEDNSKEDNSKEDNSKEDNSKKDNSKEDNSIVICGNTAFYCHEELNNDGTYRGVCKTHFKKLKIPRLPEINAKKCWNDGCSSKTVQVLKSHIFKGYCKKHINEMTKEKTHSESDFLKINHAKTTAKIDINQLGISLFQELNKLKVDITLPDIILLENQPVLKNPTMKSMQMFLYSYYLMNILDTNTIASKKLQCYCAIKKLDMIKYLPDTEQTRINTFIDTVNNPYQKNKKMSIMMVEVLLQGNTKWLDFFKSHPKQDDLADSLLMTLHYFTKNSVNIKIPLTEKEKSCTERTFDKKTKGKLGLKPSNLPVVDAESSFILDEVKSKKRNRIINNNKYKNNNDIDSKEI